MTVSITQVTDMYPTSLNVQAFINSAQIIAGDALSDKGLSSDLTDQIILYLTLHLLVLASENGGLRRSKTGDADESYKVPGDKEVGFTSTRFGQMALILDSSGTLAGLSANRGLKALIEVV